ncbi:hypothetical protein HanIR_Chr13g0668811 [Helianthus annuus]|nr:hypothetical protein HanIR_Chr13g0668811 [Helianthus annuus]
MTHFISNSKILSCLILIHYIYRNGRYHQACFVRHPNLKSSLTVAMPTGELSLITRLRGYRIVPIRCTRHTTPTEYM